MLRQLTNALMTLPAALVSLPALAQPTAGGPDYGHYGWDWGWGHMIFGSVMMVLFWGGIIVLIVLAVRWMGGGTSHGPVPPSSQKSALDILERRFAQGEIDKEEFEERKRLLSE
jgi:putative membrane protein